ncbi:MAG: hypothetical protein FWE05_11830, partial [Defluviitaleaceae bacterium]|nr:hypothetical protein [Defluviitaleaceae bacterium]
MKTEAKNRALWGLRAALALWIAFFLSRFTFFSLHYMSQWPFALFVFGLIVIFTSAILDGRKVMIATPTGYTVGFALGMLFNIDSLDAGSGALNNAWKIWIGTYLAFIVLGIIWEIVTRLIKKCKTNNNLRRSIRKDTFILALTLVVLFTFTACGSNSNTEAPAEEQGNNDISSDIEIIINSSWQEAYTEILRLYATGQHLNEWETGWEFTLHDINQDGIPELFLGARQISGHIDYRYVYTFLGGEEI